MDRLSGFLGDHSTETMALGAIIVALAGRNGPIVFLLLGAFLVGLGAWFRAMQRSQHKIAAEYQGYATARGFQVAAERAEVDRQFDALVSLLGKGHGHYWRNQFSGQIDGIPFSTFECVYTTGYGKFTSEYTFAVMYWPVATKDFPRFTIGPHVSDLLGYVFGSPDIVFVADPRFSALYSLKGPDTAVVAALFPSSVRRFFVVHQGQHMAGGGHDLFWWRGRSLPPPEQIDDFLAEGNSIRKLFVHDGGGASETAGADDDDQETETEHHIYIKR